MDKIWDADMKFISKFNKVFRFLLCNIDIYRKYAWVVPWVIPTLDEKNSQAK